MRIGTRGSALALAQAGWVAARLGPDTELVTITTAGDRGVQAGDKSRWISALERALLAGEIDLAVHSAKDVPAELADGLELVAVPARADARDALCGAASIEELRPGARVGTSSLRRAAQLRAAREDLDVVEVRGNVDTRLRTLDAGEVDALVLAMAGLERLGRGDRAGGLLDVVPAAGQGALAVEAAPGTLTPQELDRVENREARLCVSAERELTQALDATCDTPVGAHARLIGGDELELRAWVGLPDGSAWIADRARGAAGEVAASVARRLASAGAAELLRRAAREAGAPR